MTHPTLTALLRPGALVAIALLAAVELGVARSTWLWSSNEASPSGVVDALERHVIDAAAHPAVVLLGNSRTRDAVIPRQLERELGAETGSVLNLGLTGGSLFDSMMLYQRNRAKLGSARWVVVQVEQNAFLPVRPRERFRRFASLGDRVRLLDFEERASVVLGFFWKTYDAQAPLKRFLRGEGGGSRLAIGADGRVQWREDAVETGPETLDFTAQWQPPRSLEVDPLAVSFLQRLLDMIEADGPRVAFFRSPVRDDYLDAGGEYAEQLEATMQQVLTRIAPDVPRMLYHRGSELGIANTGFYDYGHATESSAVRITSTLATDLKRLARP